jgi:hypothetical protein
MISSFSASFIVALIWSSIIWLFVVCSDLKLGNIVKEQFLSLYFERQAFSFIIITIIYVLIYILF